MRRKGYQKSEMKRNYKTSEKHHHQREKSLKLLFQDSKWETKWIGGSAKERQPKCKNLVAKGARARCTLTKWIGESAREATRVEKSSGQRCTNVPPCMTCESWWHKSVGEREREGAWMVVDCWGLCWSIDRGKMHRLVGSFEKIQSEKNPNDLEGFREG